MASDNAPRYTIDLTKPGFNHTIPAAPAYEDGMDEETRATVKAIAQDQGGLVEVIPEEQPEDMGKADTDTEFRSDEDMEPESPHKDAGKKRKAGPPKVKAKAKAKRHRKRKSTKVVNLDMKPNSTCVLDVNGVIGGMFEFTCSEYGFIECRQLHRGRVI